MNEEDFNQLMDKTTKTQEVYAANVGRRIIITDTEMLKKYDYRTTRFEYLRRPEEFGFNDHYLGGNVYKVGKVANSPWHVLINRGDISIYMFMPIDRLKELTLTELKWLCDKFKIEYNLKINKSDIITLLTYVFE